MVKVKQILLDWNSFCIHLTPSEKVHFRVVHQQYEQEPRALWQTRRIPLSHHHHHRLICHTKLSLMGKVGLFACMCCVCCHTVCFQHLWSPKQDCLYLCSMLSTFSQFASHLHHTCDGEIQLSEGCILCSDPETTAFDKAHTIMNAQGQAQAHIQTFHTNKTCSKITTKQNLKHNSIGRGSGWRWDVTHH